MTKITISIQDDLYLRLKQFIPARQISKFFSDSIKKELINKENELLAAYKEAYADPNRNQIIDEWDILNVEVDEGSANHKKTNK